MTAPQPFAWRSLLYVPGHKYEFIEKAHQRHADAIILDLEDGVPTDSKVDARQSLPASVTRTSADGADVLVRVNRPWSLAWRDIEAAVDAGAAGLVLPKVDHPGQIAVIDEFLNELESGTEVAPLALVALIETAVGLRNAHRIAAGSSRVRALVPGNEDLALSLGIEPDVDQMSTAIWPLVVAAKAAGIALVGTVGGSADFRDLDTFREHVLLSARLGFDGSTCIHPDQIAVIHDVYRPSPERFAEAQKIVAAFEQAEGDVVGLHGKMVDRPVYMRAKRLLERYEVDGA